MTRALTRICVVSRLRNFLIFLMLYKWKKADLHRRLMWLFSLSWLSSQHPRFLTSEDEETSTLPTLIESMLTFSSCCLVPITKNSVLSSFIFKRSFYPFGAILLQTKANCFKRMHRLVRINVDYMLEIYFTRDYPRMLSAFLVVEHKM